MIDLTDDQLQALRTPEDDPPRVRNPRTDEVFVLVSVKEFERLTAIDYDDSPWTREEREALAWEAGRAIGWDDMDEYDLLPEKS